MGGSQPPWQPSATEPATQPPGGPPPAPVRPPPLVAPPRPPALPCPGEHDSAANAVVRTRAESRPAEIRKPWDIESSRRRKTDSLSLPYRRWSLPASRLRSRRPPALLENAPPPGRDQRAAPWHATRATFAGRTSRSYR